MNGDVPAIVELLENGADADESNRHGETPLILASQVSKTK